MRRKRTAIVALALAQFFLISSSLANIGDKQRLTDIQKLLSVIQVLVSQIGEGKPKQ
jgi:hypothetical protein